MWLFFSTIKIVNSEKINYIKFENDKNKVSSPIKEVDISIFKNEEIKEIIAKAIKFGTLAVSKEISHFAQLLL